MEKSKLKVIKASLRTKDVDNAKVEFRGGMFTPAEFTSMFMAILETYTEGLLAVNDRKDVFEHFNNVFGTFLNKIVPEDEHYKLSKAHKDLKDVVDDTLGRDLTDSDKKENEDARFSAYLLCRDILVNELGLTEESADVLLNKRLNIVERLDTPILKNEKER